jgi:hypothetical protein
VIGVAIANKKTHRKTAQQNFSFSAANTLFFSGMSEANYTKLPLP